MQQGPPQAGDWASRGPQNSPEIGLAVLLRPSSGPLPPRRQLPCCPRAWLSPAFGGGCCQGHLPLVPQRFSFPVSPWAPLLSHASQVGPSPPNDSGCLIPTTEWARFRSLENLPASLAISLDIYSGHLGCKVLCWGIWWGRAGPAPVLKVWEGPT